MEHNERRIVGNGVGRVGRGQSCWTFELVSGIWVVIEKQDSTHTHACTCVHVHAHNHHLGKTGSHGRGYRRRALRVRRWHRSSAAGSGQGGKRALWVLLQGPGERT